MECRDWGWWRTNALFWTGSGAVFVLTFCAGFELNRWLRIWNLRRFLNLRHWVILKRTAMGIHAVQRLAPVASTESAPGSATGATSPANSECILSIQVVMPCQRYWLEFWSFALRHFSLEPFDNSSCNVSSWFSADSILLIRCETSQDSVVVVVRKILAEAKSAKDFTNPKCLL